jgi:hypothetical protein
LLQGCLRNSWKWPPVLLKVRGIANYIYLRVTWDCELRPDADATGTIYIATKPFAGGRRRNSRCPYHRLAWNSLIAYDCAFRIDCLYGFFQAYIYAQLRQTKPCCFRETFRERSKRAFSHFNQDDARGIWVNPAEVLP